MTTLTPPRPNHNDLEVRRLAAIDLAPKVKEWIGDDTDLKEIEADLIEAIRYGDDGYRVAKELDGNYNSDAALVEILDDTFYAKRNALDALQEQWVKENGLQPIPIDTKVRDPKRERSGVGLVTSNYPTGKASVYFEQLGHVKKGPGTYGIVINWEELEIIHE